MKHANIKSSRTVSQWGAGDLPPALDKEEISLGQKDMRADNPTDQGQRPEESQTDGEPNYSLSSFKIKSPFFRQLKSTVAKG